ncbi:MAG: ADP-ribosylation factor 1-like protein [Benniella sp.]|nr:MAG: ADP-ribosylation factor 1-like protein [Benniella sp.]
MGSALSSFHSFFVFSQDPTKTLMIGIDGAGKTNILYRLKLGGKGVWSCLPTIGFNIETVTYNNFTMTIWDVGGGTHMPNFWRHLFQDTVGIILVVDSSDTYRIGEVKDHLWRLLNEDEFRDLPLLVYANKQDLKSAMLVADVRDALNLNALRGREWHIQGASALNGEGLKEGQDWYITQLKENRKRNAATWFV